MDGDAVALKVCEVVSILLWALVMGVFWGPWIALSRSMATFEPEMFLAIGHRLVRNLEGFMPVLMPAALLSIAPVLWLSNNQRREGFYLTLAGLGFFGVAIVVTMVVEVPISKQIKSWTIATLPVGWQELRDRWQRFHVVRVVVSVAGMALLLSGAIF